jgi:hypothetical protein
MRAIARRTPRPPPVTGLVVALVALAALVAAAWWEGDQWRDAPSAHVSVGAAVVVAWGVALVAGRQRQWRTTTTWWRDSGAAWRDAGAGYRAGLVVWAVLVTALVVWDVVSFAAQAHALPTLSREVGRLTAHHGGRALAVAVWLVLGGWLALGRRRGRPEVPG